MPLPLPTIFLVGVNRSGTSALMHSFANHPAFEVIKDPEKFAFESRGEMTFRHFSKAPTNENVRARLIKQSVGQYTVDLCCLPLYPIGPERVPLLRELVHAFIVRRPSQVWNSWAKMTKWIRASDDPEVIAMWSSLTEEYGIEKGWGDLNMFRLAYTYVYTTFAYVRRLCPDRVVVIQQERLAEDAYARATLKGLCSAVGVAFDERMVQWNQTFGDKSLNVTDGFADYGSIDSLERREIHRNLRASSSFAKTEAALVIPESEASAMDSGELGRFYEEMIETRNPFVLGEPEWDSS